MSLPLILVIDDSLVVRAKLKELFENDGFQVALADTLNQGRELAVDLHPDIIVLDLVLPDGDGIDLCREFRLEPDLEDTPILLVSGERAGRDDWSEGLAAGALGYIIKPFDDKVMLAQIRALAHLNHTYKKLRDSEQRMELAMWGGDVGVWDWHVNTGELVVTELWAGMLGYRKDEIEPHIHSWENRIHPDDAAEVRDLLKAHLEGRTPIYESQYRLQAKSGEWKWILDRGKVVERDPKGNPLRVTGTHLDITDKKYAEDLIIQAEKMASLGGLAAGMAQEISGPLGHILQNTQAIQNRLICESGKNREQAEACNVDLSAVRDFLDRQEVFGSLNCIWELGARAAAIVDAVLQFSQPGEAHATPSDLAYLINETLRLAANDCEMKRDYRFDAIMIEREFDSEIPEVHVVAPEICQVILNLLKNSAQAIAGRGKHAESVTGTFDAGESKPKIILRLRKEKGWVKIEVEDNGPGISDSDRKRIFEPFFTTRGVGKGVGLGLSVAYAIVTKNHRGTMSVDSSPGRGTRFVIRLPFADENAEGECSTGKKDNLPEIEQIHTISLADIKR